MQLGKLTYNLNAGRRACAQLVRAVPPATSAPLRRAAAGSALSTLHEMLKRAEFCLFASFTDDAELREVALAVINAYSISLREVAAFGFTEPHESKESQDGQEGSRSGNGAVEDPLAGGGAAAAGGGGQSRTGSSGDSSGGAGSSCGTSGSAASRAKGASPEDWVPLLVDSSGVIGCCIQDGVVTTKDGVNLPTIQDDKLRKQLSSCAVSLASALLHSDALPALSRLLSAEAQRGPARALLSPGQLATCLQPLTQLLMATAAGWKSVDPFQRLGPAVLHAVAESGVVEAACRAAVQLVVQQGGGRRQQQQVGCRAGDGGREHLLSELMELLSGVSSALSKADSVVQPQLQRRILAGPCVQVCYFEGGQREHCRRVDAGWTLAGCARVHWK